MSSRININEAVLTLSKNELKELEKEYQKLDYLKKLNLGQKIAATRNEGNYLVIAGPGTGKTYTLVYRVVHLVKTGVDPKSIVVITFTRKAGQELKNRINLMLPNTSLGFVGTFHAFSNHISALIGSSSPISKFRLLDPEDDIGVHNLVLADYKEFNKNLKAKRLQKIISYCVNTQMSVKDYITTFDLHDLTSDIENIEEYKHVYERYKVNHMLASYDDMITLITNYLKRDESQKLTAPFEFLMIDEYQDTNQMQLDFIKTINIQNVMAIGDDFQGIYSFRGADHRIILNFYNDFKDAKMIKLIENYRSSDKIIDWINHTTKKSQLGYQKALKPVKTSSGNTTVVSGKSMEEYKDFIISNIKSNPKASHALIYRYNKNRTVFEKAMIEENIEYSVYGGIRLLERKHIKDVLAFLMVHLNRLDIVSYNRILTMLPGVGAKTAKTLIKNDLNDISRLSGQKLHFVSQIRDIINSQETKEVIYKNICDFYFSIYEYVESEYYSKEDIEDDFKLIRDLIESYDSLHNFIINLILDPVVDLNRGKNPKVVLTTIHSAKGLEFDNVYYFHSHDWYKNYNIEGLEEDRRLFYVGISRAKENLFLFDHTEISRTFDEIIRDFENSISYTDNLEATKDIKDTNEKGDFIENEEGMKRDVEVELKDNIPNNVIELNTFRKSKSVLRK